MNFWRIRPFENEEAGTSEGGILRILIMILGLDWTVESLLARVIWSVFGDLERQITIFLDGIWIFGALSVSEGGGLAS